MLRLRQIASRRGLVTLLLLACATVITAWLASYHWAPATAWTSKGERTHIIVRGGTIWLTRGGGPAALAGARPVFVQRGAAIVRRTQDVERSLRTHAAFLRSRLGENDPEAAAEIARADALKRARHDDLLARIAVPHGEPIVAETAPDVSHAIGLTVERGIARFPERQPDGVIDYGSPVAFTSVAVPCWSVAAFLALFPAFAGIRGWFQRRRLQPGLCPSCGYDMRATPDRCPECGQMPEQHRATAAQESLL
ncbi:MAG: hypothetical protein JWN40_2854 [Phycisphaerales bacterium]|nr:hypothetical protein [Phycisphaerales bacterium]